MSKIRMAYFVQILRYRVIFQIISADSICHGLLTLSRLQVHFAFRLFYGFLKFNAHSHKHLGNQTVSTSYQSSPMSAQLSILSPGLFF